MIEKQALTEQQIIDHLKSEYNIPVMTLVRLPFGADMNAWVYQAKTQDQSYFVKLRGDHHLDINASILALLHDVGIQQIIQPVKTKMGESVKRIHHYTLTLFPFVEGQDGFSRDLTDDQWVTLGKVMRQIHEINVPPSIQAVIRREDYSAKWQNAVRALYAHMESKPDGDEIAMQLITFMQQHSVTIHRLVDQAEKLSQQIQNDLPAYVLCHSDIHGGNVLIDRNDIIYIVDWDVRVMAPNERDLMFVGGGVGNIWNQAHEEALFYKGYGRVDINAAILSYYRCERIVEDIAQIGQQLLLTSEGGKKRAESYQHFTAQFEPRGVVESAFLNKLNN
jgi:spectinomycin phosphotransferase